MPLDPKVLAKAIAAALAKQAKAKDNPAASAQELASDIAEAVDGYIKSATLTVAAGIPVSTTGSPAAQTGATTGTGTVTIA